MTRHDTVQPIPARAPDRLERVRDRIARGVYDSPAFLNRLARLLLSKLGAPTS